jgi:peptide-methionine (S)-S-oxide reductase
VIRTRVGYAGGTTKNPTYRNLGDHSETVEIDFDPARISYAELLTVFWASHHPGVRPWSRQYLAAIFYHDEAQKKLALESREKAAARVQGEVFTQVMPATKFYLAEDYHQKYFLRQAPELFGEMAAFYPAARDLIGSTAAARLNGYVAGYGTPGNLKKELDALGLSAASREKLLALAAAKESQGATPGCPLPR